MNSTGSMLSTNNIGTTIQSSTNELMTFLDSNSLVAKNSILIFRFIYICIIDSIFIIITFLGVITKRLPSLN